MSIHTLLLAGSVLLQCGVAAAAEVPAFRDHIVFGRSESEEQHTLRTAGTARNETLTTTLGTLTETYPVRTLAGKGAGVTVALKNPDGKDSAVLEVQEIHNRRIEAYGYTVLVNGHEVYFRTYEEMGAGPNHYFVNLPLEILGEEETVEVALRSEGGAPFSVGQLWIYGDFFTGIARQEKTQQRMALYSDANAAVKESVSFEEKVRIMQERIDQLTCFGPYYPNDGIGYSTDAVSLSQGRLDTMLQQVEATGLSLSVNANGSCYGGALTGPDGLGGDFVDVQYNPVHWNPFTGRKNASWPNLWNNVPSHSWANPRLVDVLRRKFMLNLRYLSERMCHLEAAGTLPAGEFQFVRELGIASDMYSDYNPYNIAAALKDGITLDPRDGLTREERLWLYNSITHIFEWMSQDYAAALGRAPVRVDRGTVRYPSYQWLDNLYMHTQMHAMRPHADLRWWGWQTGVHPEAWSSGEFDVHTRMDDYLRAQGSLAKVNQERQSLKDHVGDEAREQYEAGYRFVLYYSLLPDDEKLLAKADNCDGEPGREAPHFDPSSLDVIVDRDGLLGPAGKIIEVKNLEARATPCAHHTAKMAVVDPSSPGVILYRLTNSGEAFPSGMSLTAMGRISAGEENRIEIAGGARPDELQTLKVLRNSDLPKPERWRLHQTSTIKVDLGDGAKGRKEYYLRLTFHSPGAFDASFLHELQIGIKWPRRSGQLMGSPFTIGENRTASLWIQDRGIARRSLKRYSEFAGEDEHWRQARDLFEKGLYKRAHQSLVGPLSEVLPARYAVRGHGRLGRYPVSITLGDPDATAVVTLESLSADGVALQVSTDVDQELELRVSDLEANQSYEIVKRDGNHYRLERIEGRSDLSRTTTDAGELQVTLTAQKPTPRKMTARALSGAYVHGGREEIKVWCQDLELMGYSSELALPVADDVETSRQPALLSSETETNGAGQWPKRDDRVRLALNDQGEVVKIEAHYGIDRGVITAFHPPAWFPPCNGIVTLDNERKYELKTSTECNTIALRHNLMQYEVEHWQEAFKPGQPLEITFCPYTGGMRLPRILTAKQPYTVVMDLDYITNEGTAWRDNAVEAKGINVVPRLLDPTYLRDWSETVLYPDAPFEPGHVVYKVEREMPFEQAIVEFIGRLFEDSSRMEFLVSTDPARDDWTQVADYGNGWANYMVLGPFTDEKGRGKYAFVDVSDLVRGKKTFYLKIRLTRHADDCRYGLVRVRVVADKGTAMDN